jgi:hypothetical protein
MDLEADVVENTSVATAWVGEVDAVEGDGAVDVGEE